MLYVFDQNIGRICQSVKHFHLCSHLCVRMINKYQWCCFTILFHLSTLMSVSSISLFTSPLRKNDLSKQFDSCSDVKGLPPVKYITKILMVKFELIPHDILQHTVSWFHNS